MYTSNALVFLPILAFAAGAAAKGIWATPHDAYSSSIGVLGCKVNTNRIAYWPGSVDCNNICVKVSYEGRSVHLLRIDSSAGAYDISYDAWNYLQTGDSATKNPIAGGTVAMEAEEVDASECASLIKTPGSKLPLSASNSINFLSSCLAQPSSWVANNHVLYNICDPLCALGQDEVCTLDLAVSNQPSCPHTLGLQTKLTSAPVYDIKYQTGKVAVAGSGEAAPDNAISASDIGSGSAGQGGGSPAPQGGVFAEYSASKPPAEVPSSTYIPAVVPTTSYPAVAPSSSQSSASVETTSSAYVPVKPSSSVIITASYETQTGGAGGYTPIPTGGKPSTTLSMVTYSSKPSPSSNGNGTAPSAPSAPPVSGGNASARVSALAVVVSMIICSILGAF